MTAADDGRQIADINGAVGRAPVPPGRYTVQFANGMWRGVDVRPGETTTRSQRRDGTIVRTRK